MISLMRSVRLTLTIYFVVFFTACAPRQVSIEEARRIQTHIFSVGMQTTMDAVISSLQDRLYMIDDVNSDLNIIMASRSTDKKLVDTVVETSEDDVPLWLKITGVALVLAFIGFLVYTFSGNNSDDECSKSSNDNCNHDHNHYHFNSPDHDYSTDKTYRYKLNVNLSETDDGRTKVRIIAQGEYLENGKIVRAGSIQDPKFYNRIFTHIDNVIFNY